MKYESKECFSLKGRGKVYIVENEKGRAWHDFDDLIGNEVEINGELKQVIGVEKYAKHYISEGEPIGLLVEETMI